MKSSSSGKQSSHTIETTFPYPYEDLKVKLSGTAESLKMLYWLSLGNPQIVREVIGRSTEAIYQRLTQKPGRGIHNGRERFMARMKILTAYLYRHLLERLKEPRETWPEPLEAIVKDFEASPYSRRKPRIKPSKLVAHIMERNYGKERRKHGLKKWTEDVESFRRTFVSNNKFRVWFVKPEKYFPPIFAGRALLTLKDPSEFISLLKSL